MWDGLSKKEDVDVEDNANTWVLTINFLLQQTKPNQAKIIFRTEDTEI